MTALSQKRCLPCEGGVEPLAKDKIDQLLKQLPDWKIDKEYKRIAREFSFNAYSKVILFVNAIAWIAENEGHHPDLEVSYSRCYVTYSTHAIDGLSENDFICAAKVNALIEDK